MNKKDCRCVPALNGKKTYQWFCPVHQQKAIYKRAIPSPQGWESRLEDMFPFWKTGQDCMQEPTNTAKYSIKEFIRQTRQEAYEEGLKASHKTENGYCCACEWDILIMNDKIKNAKQKIRTQALQEVIGIVEEAKNEYLPKIECEWLIARLQKLLKT
jgi:hypothetical protein